MVRNSLNSLFNFQFIARKRTFALSLSLVLFNPYVILSSAASSAQTSNPSSAASSAQTSNTSSAASSAQTSNASSAASSAQTSADSVQTLSATPTKSSGSTPPTESSMSTYRIQSTTNRTRTKSSISAPRQKQFAGTSSKKVLIAATPQNIASTATVPGLPSHPAFKIMAADKASGLIEYKLKSNGLSVLLGETHTAPVTVVNVVYKVGSRNEAVGYTGATHFLEHMMFKGTMQHDPLKGTGLDDLLKPVGGYNNATTYYDRTNYYEVVPSKDLNICLEVEADRMRHALLRKTDREAEMTVVRNELERDENYASSNLDMQVFATAFREHPYHHPVIGWRADVEGVPLERLKQFYNDFYYPNNATLIVLGDFKTADALKAIDQYFSKVPASTKPFPRVYTTEPPQEGERRFTVQRGDELPKLILGYHIPKATDKDTYPLEVLASILGDEKRQSSRLYKRLVDSGLASEADASSVPLHDPGLFTIEASANKDTKLESIERAIENELTLLALAPVSQTELDRAKNALWKGLKIQSTDPSLFTQQLTEAIAVADWKWGLDLEKNIRAVTAADVQRVAKKYFSQSNRSVGFYYPKISPSQSESKEADLKSYVNPADEPVANFEKSPKAIDATIATSEQFSILASNVGPIGSQEIGSGSNFDSRSSGTSPINAPNTSANLIAQKERASTLPSDKYAAPGPFPSKDSSQQRIAMSLSSDKQKFASRIKKKVLANGLQVYAMSIPGSGCVSVSGKIKAGTALSPAEQSLLPSFVAQMLNKGSKSISKEKMANELELIGASFDPDTEHFWTEFKADLVKEDLPTYLDLASVALREPNFADKELDKLKKQTEAALADAMVETGQLARNKLFSSIYKADCVYYEKPFPDQVKEVEKTQIADLKEFHKRNYVANNAIISIVGDISPEQAFLLVEKSFGSWQSGNENKIKIDACSNQAPGQTMVSQLKDKSSVDIVIGQPIDVSIKSKEFFAAEIINAALGHDTISSRLAELRNKYGLTYGVDSSFSDVSEPYAAWQITLTVNPENTSKSLKLLSGIVNKFYKDGLTNEELAIEKKRLSGEYIVNRLRTPGSIAALISRYATIDVPMSFIDNHSANLERVTLSEANAAIKKFIDLKTCTTSLAGTVPKLKP